MLTGTEGPLPASPPPPSCAGIARQLGGDLAASLLLVCAALKAGLRSRLSAWGLPEGPFCSQMGGGLSARPLPPSARGIAKRFASRCRRAGAAPGCSVSGRPQLWSASGARGEGE